MCIFLILEDSGSLYLFGCSIFAISNQHIYILSVYLFILNILVYVSEILINLWISLVYLWISYTVYCEICEILNICIICICFLLSGLCTSWFGLQESERGINSYLYLFCCETSYLSTYFIHLTLYIDSEFSSLIWISIWILHKSSVYCKSWAILGFLQYFWGFHPCILWNLRICLILFFHSLSFPISREFSILQFSIAKW